MAYTTINKSTDYFNTKLYTGTGSSNAVTGVGFQPDWVWIKNRDAAYWHNWYDAVRGTNKSIASNATNAEETRTNFFNSFDSDGFTVNSTDQNVNASSENFVAWNWKAGTGQGSSNTDGSINTTYTSVNTTAGFSICKWTGNATNSTIGHGLGAVPKVVIIKNLSNGSAQWVVYHVSTGNTQACYLNTTSTPTDVIGFFNDTTPTSSVFTVGTDTAVNGSGNQMIAYCFAEKTGYSKFGSYTGNGNADGSFIYTGFKPAFVLVKNTQQGGDDWYMFDNKRSSFNQVQANLKPNTNSVEASSTSYAFDFLSNGFKVRASTGAINNNNETMIYMAFGQSLVGSNNVPATAR